jgi:hypothetical protein
MRHALSFAQNIARLNLPDHEGADARLKSRRAVRGRGHPQISFGLARVNALAKFLQISKPPRSVNPLTVITVIAFRDHDVDRSLAPSSVVRGHLLCAADIIVV